MADISKFKLGSTTYSLKDSEARAAIEVLQTSIASSLIFKGVITSATELTELTDYEAGWTYKIGANFSITGLGQVESGDMVVCITSGSSYLAPNWTVIQNNVDTMEGATSSADGVRGLVPAPAAGEQNDFLRGDGTWATPSEVTSAVKLTTSAGSTYVPVYFASGIPTVCKTPSSGSQTGIGVIRADGVMELGKYLDLHASTDSTADYDVRITCNTSGINISGTTTGTFSGALSGNASTATKLATARTVITNLASTSSASFNGSANITPGVTGILSVANGGTGNSDGSVEYITWGSISDLT